MQKQKRLNSTGRRAPDTRDLSPVSKCCSFSQTNQLRLCCTTVASTQNLFPNKRAVGIFVAFSMMSHRTGTFHDFPESFSRDLAKMCFWSSAFEKQFAFHPLPHPPAPHMQPLAIVLSLLLGFTHPRGMSQALIVSFTSSKFQG